MVNRYYYNEISERYNILVSQIKSDNSNNLQDSNNHIENFYRDFLNCLRGWSLKNANTNNPRQPGYDLIDRKNGILVQVSSTFNYNSIKEKLQKTETDELKEYQYYFMAITQGSEKTYKVKHRDYPVPNGLRFNACEHIIDSNDLMREVKDKGPDEQQKLLKVVKKYTEKNRTTKRAAIATALVALVLIAVILFTQYINSWKQLEQLNKGIQLLNDGFQSIREGQNSILAINEIDPEKAAITYKSGMESYRGQQYGTAAKQFEEAIAEQEKITGAGSSEVGRIHCMLGLSRIYSGNVFKDNGNDAISAFNRAIQIFKQNNDLLDLARCYYFLGTAYFEPDDMHLNRAKEQVENSIKLLDEYYSEEGKLLVYSFDNNTELRFFTDSYDYETIYRASNYYHLLQEDYNLLGKIAQKSDSYSDAFYYYNKALKMNALFLNADYALASCDYSDSVEINNSEIKSYLNGKTVGTILESSKKIKVYSFDVENSQINFEEFTYEQVYASADTATILTNRAMSEITLGQAEIAAEDCSDAIDIWNELPFSSRTNISYSYNSLVLSYLGIAEKSKDPEAYLEEREQELKDYVDTAVTYDLELYGTTHPRTAYSYETKGVVYSVFGEKDIAIESYQEAVKIYKALNRDQNVKYCLERINEL